MCELLDVGLGRVLTQRAQTLADLVLLDLSIASVVKQVEGFLELCKKGRKTSIRKSFKPYQHRDQCLALTLPSTDEKEYFFGGSYMKRPSV